MVRLLMAHERVDLTGGTVRKLPQAPWPTACCPLALQIDNYSQTICATEQCFSKFIQLSSVAFFGSLSCGDVT